MVKLKQIYAPVMKDQYKFNKEFYTLCKTMKKSVREDNDVVLAVTGKEGRSKSTCLNQLGFHTDKHYSLTRNVIYSPSKKTMEQKLFGLPRFSFINADEAIKILYKQLWHSPLQIYLNQLFRLCRQENMITGLAMPRFYDFNEGFRNHRIEIWIHMLKKGLGAVFIKDDSPWVKDPWWFGKNQKMLDRARKMQGKKLFAYNVEEKIKLYQEADGYWGVITFPDMDEPLRLEYKELANKHKYEGLTEQYEQTTKFAKYTKFYHGALQKAIVQMRIKDKNLSQRDIAKKLGISKSLTQRIITGKTQGSALAG